MSAIYGDISGAWRLVWTRSIGADGLTGKPPFGPRPLGQLLLTQDGHVLATICDGRPGAAPGRARSFSSYCGTFRIEDNRLVTMVDSASNPAFVGSEQVREIGFEGEMLVLTPPPSDNGGIRLEFGWTRTSDS